MRHRLFHAFVITLLTLIVSNLSQAFAIEPPQSCVERYIGTTDSKGVPTQSSLCTEISSKGKVLYRRYNDGTYLPNIELVYSLDQGPPTSDTAAQLTVLERLSVASPSQKLQVKLLAARIQSTIIEMVQNGVADANLSKMQRFLIKRIRSLAIKIDQRSGLCKTAAPNAFFTVDDLSINICANVTNYPIEALLPVLTHEFAHATDPCLFDILRIKSDFLEASKRGDYSALRACGYEHRKDSYMPRAPSDGGNTLLLRNSTAPTALACKVVTHEMSGLNPSDIGDHSFSQYLLCLDRLRPDSKKPLGHQISETTKEVQKVLNEVAKLENRRPLTVRAPNAGVSRDLLCSDGELYADLVGAKATDRYLEKYGQTLNEEKKQNMVFVFAAFVCHPGGSTLYGYAAPSNRIKTYLQYSQIQSALGCQGSRIKPICGESENRTRPGMRSGSVR